MSEALQRLAEALGGAAMRQGYLQNVPWHHDIVAAWGRREGGALRTPGRLFQVSPG